MAEIMTSVHFWQVVVDENRGPVLRTLAGSTGSPWLSAGGGRAVEGPPALRAGLRAVEPPEAVPGPGKMAVPVTRWAFGRNVCVCPRSCPNPRELGSLGDT